jgi:integrase
VLKGREKRERQQQRLARAKPKREDAMQANDGDDKRVKRERETGSIYKMHGSQHLWIKFYKDGRPIRQSAGSPLRTEARKLLKKRIAEVDQHTFIGLRREKIRVSELADDLIRDYRINGMKSIDDLQARWDLHLKPFFGHKRAIEVTSNLVARYIDQRQQEGAANATVNRELAGLKRLFRLAQRSTPPKVTAVPYIAILKEDNTRTGFLESKQHDALAAETGKIGLWLRAMFEVGYTFGWRHQELLSLRVKQVNLSAGTIRLEPGTTKNGEGREVSMTLPVKILLTQCVHGKTPDDHVFTRADGKPVCDFRGSWVNACTAAKVPGLLFHDLRRTAARNLRRAGVAETVIMRIGGWKTPSVFKRYAIVSQTDIIAAMTSLEAKQQLDNAEAAKENQAASGEKFEFGQSFGQSGTKNGATEKDGHFSASHLN